MDKKEPSLKLKLILFGAEIFMPFLINLIVALIFEEYSITKILKDLGTVYLLGFFYFPVNFSRFLGSIIFLIAYWPGLIALAIRWFKKGSWICYGFFTAILLITSIGLLQWFYISMGI